MWKHWTCGVLGIFVVLTPYLGLGTSIEQWFLVIVGIVIAVLAFWSASEGRDGAIV